MGDRMRAGGILGRVEVSSIRAIARGVALNFTGLDCGAIHTPDFSTGKRRVLPQAHR
jgi:hypothetical protein